MRRHRSLVRPLVLAVLLVVAGSGCGGDDGTTSADQERVATDPSTTSPPTDATPRSDAGEAGLTATQWTVDALIQGDVASTPPTGVVATLRFSDDGSYAVATGCNTGSGTFEIRNDVLDLTPPTLTKVACKADAGGVEQAVVAVLDGEVAFTVTGDRLTLTKGDIPGEAGLPTGPGLGLAAG